MNRVDIGVGSLELLCYDLLTEWTSVAWFSSNRYEANALKNEWGEETHGEAEILMGKTSLFDMFRRANSDWVIIFCTYEHKSFQPHWLPASILSEEKKKKKNWPSSHPQKIDGECLRLWSINDLWDTHYPTLTSEACYCLEESSLWRHSKCKVFPVFRTLTTPDFGQTFYQLITRKPQRGLAT